jgi:hypothetical protein
MKREIVLAKFMLLTQSFGFFNKRGKVFWQDLFFSGFSFSLFIFSMKTCPFCWSKEEPYGFHDTFLFLSPMWVALRAQHST